LSIDPATSYAVIYTPTGYRKVLLVDIGAGTGGDSSSAGGGAGDGYPPQLGHLGI